MDPRVTRGQNGVDLTLKRCYLRRWLHVEKRLKIVSTLLTRRRTKRLWGHRIKVNSTVIDLRLFDVCKITLIRRRHFVIDVTITLSTSRSFSHPNTTLEQREPGPAYLIQSRLPTSFNPTEGIALDYSSSNNVRKEFNNPLSLWMFYSRTVAYNSITAIPDWHIRGCETTEA